MSNSLSDSVFRATKWSAITNVLRKLITPITNMALARILAPDAFGVVATINIVITFAEVFTDAGFQKYLVQHQFQNEDELHKSANVAFWTNFSLSMIIWGAIFVFRDPLAILVGSEGYGIHLATASIAIPLVAFSSIQQAIYRRHFDFKGMFLPRLINALIPLAVTIPLAFVFRNCWALIIGTLAANLSDAILLTVKSKWKPKLYYSFEKFKEMFGFSAWTLLESLSIWFTLNVDVFILAKLFSDHELGLYKTGLNTVNSVVTLITTTIVPVLFSALSRNQDGKQEFANTLYSFQKNSSIILIPLSIGMFLYADVVTWILLGDQWTEAIPLIAFVSLMQFGIVLISNFASEVYRAKGEPRVSLIVQLIYIAVIIPSIYYAGVRGFESLYLIKVILYVFFILLHLFVLRFRYRFSIRKMLSGMAAPFAAALVMGGVGYLLRLVSDSMLWTVFTILVCIVIYFSLCMLIPSTKKIILDFVTRIRNRKTTSTINCDEKN